ncbi:short-chain dehydrogenase [Penicillium angulare]|uniref:short-chain dehydrogenase n=1 Tax=Penicillium angulare TaxID=116970 RepID=UPI0025409817|nr:short-chain dehydrogenase [Penicillium angulare]KAJ5291924.1 short-chain dehydrogenase [Penicillium angulare]
MPQTSEGNVHALQYREGKPSQGDPSRPVSELFRLDDHTVIITGATDFLGTTLAIAIIESGADIICLDLFPTPTASNWDDVENAAEKSQRRLSYYQLDVTDENAVAETFGKFIPTLRYPVKGVVTCAGLSRNGPATEFPASSFRKIFDINVTGTFLVAQATAREMIRTNVTGSMVLVATATAEALQKPGMEAQWTSDNMLFRLSTVDEFRAPVLFMTGTDLRVDGGHFSW